MKWEIYFLAIGQGFLCCFSSFCGFPMPFAHLFSTKSFIISSLTFRCFSILDSEPLSTFWLHCNYPLTSCCLACSWISFKNVFYILICCIKWSINFCSKVCGVFFIQFRRNHFFFFLANLFCYNKKFLAVSTLSIHLTIFSLSWSYVDTHLHLDTHLLHP